MKLIRAFILFMALAQSGWVFAAGQPFTKSQFDNLMKEGKPIIVHVHAPWCSNCKAQNSVLNVEMKSPAYKGVTFLEVDFDTQNEALRELNVSMQSTILVFKQGREVGRFTAKTKESDIEELTKKAL
jgi:thioredoxin-like negative regulator of GroEL